jgi:hypothetical protein
MKKELFNQKQLTLLLKWNEFQDLKKRDEWFRSLPLDQRAILKNALPKKSNQLF